MRKRIISLCMVLVLCLSLLPVTALAASTSYVALGDSITTGYGLEAGEQPFTETVAEERGYDLDDSLAAVGATSEDLLGVVTDPANAETLKNANLITITIGGNDLMGALYGYVAEAYNQTAQTPVTGTDIQLALMGIHPTIGQNTALFYLGLYLSGFITSGMDSALNDFQTNLRGILQQLQEHCPAAQIILANQYNPYGILKYNESYAMLANQFDAGIGKLNTVIAEVCQEFDVTVADVYSPFAAELAAGGNPCNAGIDAQGKINPDFHPNQVGHSLIAAAITAALPQQPGHEPNLYVGGVGLYGDKASQATAYAKTVDGTVTTAGATAEDYNIKWDGETLTLEDANIQRGCVFTTDGYQASLYSENSFKIELLGTNTIASDLEGEYASGVRSDEDLAISGSGTLQVTASGSTTSRGISVGGSATISGGIVTADGGFYGISIAEDLTVSGGTVTATGGHMGLYANDSVTISPQSGWQIVVTAGPDKDSATAIDGSPFRGKTDIIDLVYEKSYFNSQTTARPSSGGGSSSTTETTANPDGSTTTTVTDKATGTVTETTKWPDGSKEVIETKKDGTVTTITGKDGSRSVTSVDERGRVEAEVKLPASLVEAAQEKGEAVSLPMPEVPVTTDRDEAPTVTVDLTAGTTAQVEIPVTNVTPGTVAVLVKDNGTEEVIKTSLTTENGVAVTLSDGDTVKIVDNSKYFDDVDEDYWASEYIDFVTSREIFSGTGTNTFSPDTAMTRGMIVTVLARLAGMDTTAGDIWYEVGRQWAVEKGISDGTNLEQSLTREQLATMLWRYAGSPDTDADMSGYTDAVSVSNWARQGMAWCAEQGIIGGTTPTTLSPQGEAARAQVAVMLQKFYQLGQ